MRKLLLLVKILLVLFFLALLAFSAYNFGIIGGSTWAYQEEESILQEEKPYLLIFYSGSCAVSHEVIPYIRELEENSPAVEFIYSDVDLERELRFAHSRDVQVTPTLILYDRSGNEAASFYGTVDIETLKMEILALEQRQSQ